MFFYVFVFGKLPYQTAIANYHTKLAAKYYKNERESLFDKNLTSGSLLVRVAVLPRNSNIPCNVGRQTPISQSSIDFPVAHFITTAFTVPRAIHGTLYRHLSAMPAPKNLLILILIRVSAVPRSKKPHCTTFLSLYPLYYT